MGMQAKVFTLANTDIPTPGTRVQLNGGTLLYVESVVVQAATANTGNIFVGDASVSSSRGIQLAPGTSIEITGYEQRGQTLCLNLADLYVDTATAGNDACVVYMKQV